MACAACVMSLSAQRASDSALSASDIKDYNRIGISYNNTHYGYNDAYGTNHGDLGFGANGVGIDYIHGFSVSSSLPLYIETGLNLDFNFATESSDKEEAAGYWFQGKTNFSDINMQVPLLTSVSTSRYTSQHVSKTKSTPTFLKIFSHKSVTPRKTLKAIGSAYLTLQKMQWTVTTTPGTASRWDGM